MHTISAPLIVVAVLTVLLRSDCCQAAEKSNKVPPKTAGPPAFFLQDPNDSLCLAGSDFKRCSVNTLFYVVGSAGKYHVHKRPVDGGEDDIDGDGGTCLSTAACQDSDADKEHNMILTKCSHACANGWNILGDADSGYLLTAMNGKSCIRRPKDTNKKDGKDNPAKMGPCEDVENPYTPLQLQFASASDIATMSSGGARLIGAASDDDLDAVKALLTAEGGPDGKPVDINARDWDELTALIPAASSGHFEMVKFLVEKGIDVNAVDKDGISALMEASIMGHEKIVKYLLDHDADPSAATQFGVTALWLASSEGQAATMELLLGKGADGAVGRNDGITALMTAAAGGHEKAVELLLEAGADPMALDQEKLTPLMNAAENGSVAVLKMLVASAMKRTDYDPATYLDAISNTGFSALIIAAANGHTAVVDYLLDAGAGVDATHDSGVTALMYAAASNHADCIEILVEKGKANVEAKHTNQGTALLESCTGGSVEALQKLIEKGAAVDEGDEDGVTPLMAVASQGNSTARAILIAALRKKMNEKELKAHINIHSLSGGSAIMFATAAGHVDGTQDLMDLGANFQAIARATPEYLQKLEKMIADGTHDATQDPHVDGVTALHVAAQGGHLGAVQLLLDSGADVTVYDDEHRSALTMAIKGNYADVATALVNAGADPNTSYKDDAGNEHNLLFDAIMVENSDFAILLVEKGADLYYRDEKAVSTLLQASHRGFPDVVKALLEAHKANKKGDDTYVDGASEEGVSPLLAASSEGHDEVVKLLLEHKANANAVDKDGTTALMAAAARGHLEVVKTLVANGATNINHQNTDGHTALMFAYNGKNQVETLFERYNQFASEAAAAGGDGNRDDGGTGPLIRDALANHTALVDLLLNKGADVKIKDKEGHTAKDFDFHPDNDKMVGGTNKDTSTTDESKSEL